jgi:hypothetical protein
MFARMLLESPLTLNRSFRRRIPFVKIAESIIEARPDARGPDSVVLCDDATLEFE